MNKTFAKFDEDERKFWADFGSNLFEKRKRINMTQTDFATHLQISRCQLANIEAGRSRVDAYKLHKIERLAGTITPFQPLPPMINKTASLRDFSTSELMAEYMRRDGCG